MVRAIISNKQLNFSLCRFLLLFVALTPSSVSSQFYYGKGWPFLESGPVTCQVEANDNSSCVFSDITEFHQKGSKLNDSHALDMTKIRFENSSMDHFPHDLLVAYPNVEYLDVSGTKITRLENYDFSSNNSIVSLNMSNNLIYKLGPRMVFPLAKLETLDLSHNIVERINPTAFVYNPNFQHLNLSHNRIKKLDTSFLLPIRNLIVVKLDHNMITEISGDTTLASYRWKELYLQHNKLQSLNPNMFKSVEIFDLSMNNLKTVSLRSEALIELIIKDNELELLGVGSGLRKLDASGNKLNPMSVHMEYSRRLQYLDLSNTDLRFKDDLIGSLNKFRNLEYLDLSDVAIQIDQTTFKNLEKLQFLILSGSLMSTIPPDAFSDLKKLTTLDLSENHLRQFDFHDVINSAELSTIKLTRSRLYKLDRWQNITEKLPNLEELHIYGNKFSCAELPTIVKEFKGKNILLPTGDEDEELKEEIFIRASCIDVEMHKEEFPSHYDDSNTNVFFYAVGIFLICAIVVGFVLANKKFDLIGTISDLTKCSSGRPRTAEHLDDIPYHH